MPKSIRHFLGLVAISCGGLSAATVTFQSGVGNCGVMTHGDNFTTQCSAGNVVGQDTIYYNDTRDTFDAQGITNAKLVATVLFPIPVSNLSMDYVVLAATEALFEIYDSDGNLLTSYGVSTGDEDFNWTHTWAGSGIAKLVFRGPSGYIGISTLRFDDVSGVPEPATFALAGVALAGAAFWRRRTAKARQ